MSADENTVSPVRSGAASTATDSDEEPVNIEVDSDVVDISADVDMLDLGSDNAPTTPTVSLEDPPLPERDVDTSCRSSRPSRFIRLSNHLPRIRPRRRRHHADHQHWRSRLQLKKKESNFVAAACSMIVIVLMCTAMAEPNWFFVKGGGCRQHSHNSPVHFLGINQFFYMGQFIHVAQGHDAPYTYYKYGPNDEEGLIDCVTSKTVQVIRSMIALCSIGVVCTILAFLLDLHGPSVRVLKSVQRHAVFSMCTVAICVTVSGFCYWTTQLIEGLQVKTKPHIGNKVEVQFSIGFYLIAAAGSMAVVAAGCNLLRRPAPMEEDDRERLMHDIAGFQRDPYGPTDFLRPPPPPPYQP